MDLWYGDFVVDDKVVGCIKSGVFICVYFNNYFGGNINIKFLYLLDLFFVFVGMVEVFIYGY